MDRNSNSLSALCGNDYGGEQRRRMLRQIGRPVARFGGFITPGVPARGLIGTDVSIMDRRSVKAQLAGKGDYRAAWWHLNEAMHRFINPEASLESIMYAFHKRHHAIILGVLGGVRLFQVTFHAMCREGFAAGLRAIKEYCPFKH